MLHCIASWHAWQSSQTIHIVTHIQMNTCLHHDLWAIPSQWMVMVSPFDNNAIKSTHLNQRPCGFLSQPFPLWAKLTRKQRLGVDAAPCKLNVLLSMCSHVLVFIILLAIKVFTFVVICNYTLAANNCKSSSKLLKPWIQGSSASDLLIHHWFSRHDRDHTLGEWSQSYSAQVTLVSND